MGFQVVPYWGPLIPLRILWKRLPPTVPGSCPGSPGCHQAYGKPAAQVPTVCVFSTLFTLRTELYSVWKFCKASARASDLTCTDKKMLLVIVCDEKLEHLNSFQETS